MNRDSGAPPNSHAMTPHPPVLSGPAIWLVLGLPGTGKSALAARLAGLGGGLHLNTDIARRRLDLLGHYTGKDKDRVYATLLAEARQALRQGELVVLDGTFATETRRRPVRELARELRVPLRMILLEAREDLVLERVARPRPDSEAGPEIYLLIKAQWEPLDDPHLRLDSGATDPDTLAQLALKLLTEPTPAHEG